MLLLSRYTKQARKSKLSPPLKKFDLVFYEPCLSPFYDRPLCVLPPYP